MASRDANHPHERWDHIRPNSSAFCAGEDQRPEPPTEQNHPHERWDHSEAKVRGSGAGEGRRKDATEQGNHPHEREGDKSTNSSAFRAGEDPRGALATVSSLTYFTPDGSHLPSRARLLQPGSTVVLLRLSQSTKACGDRGAMVLGPDGVVGWVWLSHLNTSP